MSVTLASKYDDEETYECDHCGAEHHPRDAVKSYCSHECYLHGEGERILRHVTRDHRWCASCWRPVKTVNKPPTTRYTKAPDHPEKDRWQLKDIVIGYQYPTKHMVVTEAALGGSDGDRLIAPSKVDYTCWGCRCGNTDLGSRHDVLEEIEDEGLLDRVYHCLASFHEEGQFDQSPDRDQLEAAFDEQPGEWAYVIGRALFADS